MPALSTHLRTHEQVRDARCVLCGAVYGQFYIGVILSEDGEAVGDVCPRCLSEPPCQRARVIWARASRLWAEVGEALSRAEALREETATLTERGRRDHRQRAWDRLRRAEDRAGREAERRRRMVWPGPAEPEPAPATAEEKAGLAELLLSLAEGLGGLPEWPTALAEVEAAEALAVQVHFPGLPEEEVSRGVGNRYRGFISRTA